MTCRPLCLLLLLCCTTAVRADYVSQSIALDQSNTFGDGPSYGSVLLEAYDGVGAAGGGLAAGSVRITYTADVLAIYGTLGNFGIDRVALNTDLLTLQANQISGPKDWTITADSQLNGFGIFSWDLHKQKGPDRLDPVVVNITGLGLDATIAHFLIASTQQNGDVPPQGGTAFVAHVAGFSGTAANNFTGSHFIGDPVPENPGPNVTPEPSSLMLLGTGLALLGFTAVRRRRVAAL